MARRQGRRDGGRGRRRAAGRRAGFEAPERGSADELLDAGAHAPIDAMRHSTAHVMAEAVLDLFPGAKLGIGPAIDNGFYYDFQLPRPVTPDDLERDRGAHAGEREGGPPVRPRRSCRSTRRGRSSSARDRTSRSRSSTTSRRRPRPPASPPPSRRSTSTARSTTCAAGPHVESTGQDRAVQAARGLGRLLARRPGARVDAAHLRHGLGDAGGARPVPVATRARRRSATTAGWACSSTCSASTTSRPARRSGTPRAGDLQHAPGRDARAPGAARVRGDLHAAARAPEAVGAVRALGRCTATTCSWSRPRAQTFSLKPMNCPESTFVYQSRGCAPIATCRCASPSTACCTATSGRACVAA